GSLVSLTLAERMTGLFSSGIVSAPPTLPFALAVLVGAGGWVALATAARLPVSTTHALVGALLGAGAQLAPGAVAWGTLATAVGAFGLVPAGADLRVLAAAVAAAMALGGLTLGAGVARVLGERVVPMNHLEGFRANLATAALVGVGANLGLPMSTTQVATGAIAG